MNQKYTSDKSEIRRFWGDVYDVAYKKIDKDWTLENLLQALIDLEDMFKLRRQLATEEMPLTDLKDKRVLEIGPGAGGHSALFAKYGAIMASLDITFERTQATQEKFNILGDMAEGCQALQGDAEQLPFEDAGFDVVYSNGVLHHTKDTEKSIGEVFRVLKPGGIAVVMLYCKSSWHYWFNMFFFVGLLKGKVFSSKNWLGHATEWVNRDTQPSVNPFTKCYTSRTLYNMFCSFEKMTVRKSSFFFI